MHKRLIRISIIAIVLIAATATIDMWGRIHPDEKNLRYWHYKGQPVMLLGGSKTDHIFSADQLEEHLDEMVAVGANYVRNTMSQREGADLKPFQLLTNNKFDLDQWNKNYWRRLEYALRLCYERDIIIQIEVWDRFDFSQDHWKNSPWRPHNNINYTAMETGLADDYPAHPGRDVQPFFHTVPSMGDYQGPKSDLVRRHQERFVKKILEISLKYPNVLYVINNETSTDARWGQYWMTYVSSMAVRAGVIAHSTDMFFDTWAPRQSTRLRQALDDPRAYTFIDVSQVNSRNFDEDHWDDIHWIARQRDLNPRPLNHVKIYSDGEKKFGTGTPVDGVERFWRNLIAGSAALRFHRPDSGIGLNEIAKANIRAARKVESQISYWDVSAAMHLLSNREADEAYLAASPGERYLLYYTEGGTVTVNLTNHPGSYSLNWIDLSTGDWGPATTINGGARISIPAPSKSGWVATIVRR